MNTPRHARIECERCWARPTPVHAAVHDAQDDGALDADPAARALEQGWSRSLEGAWICRSCLEPLLALETG